MCLIDLASFIWRSILIFSHLLVSIIAILIINHDLQINLEL